MKELIKEEALDIVRQMITDGQVSQEVAEKYFPELKESKNKEEDERLRKTTIAFLEDFAEQGYENAVECIDWLIKQGNQNTIVVIPKFRVGDVIRPKGSMAEYTIESISGECYHGKGWGLHISRDDDYELVKQNPAWSEEDEEELKIALNTLEEAGQYSSAKWLKNVCLVPQTMQKSWSEEDETILNNLIYALANDRIGNNRDEYVDWLKSLKDGIQPQPKQEWSEEDKCMLDFAIRAIGLCRQYAINNQIKGFSNLPDTPQKYRELQDWLKFLRGRFTWKPSKEQMKWLHDAIESTQYEPRKQALISLYSDLMKLREE